MDDNTAWVLIVAILGVCFTILVVGTAWADTFRAKYKIDKKNTDSNKEEES